MNLFQSTATENMNDLTSQLSQFGLQPADWSLVSEQNNQIRIQNKFDASFYFLGSVQNLNGKRQWKNIQLISL